MTPEHVIAAPIICTIGHSTHPLDTFISLLKANNVVHVLDVRTMPRSHHNPQFNIDLLPASLQAAGIDYTHLPGLGGLRRSRPNSLNGGWRNASFQGYADYMQTQEFSGNVDKIAGLAAHERCALMCAEAVPWRCHRSLIADALTLRGMRVEDIIGAKGRRLHVLTPWAHVDGLKITYPPESGNALNQTTE